MVTLHPPPPDRPKGDDQEMYDIRSTAAYRHHSVNSSACSPCNSVENKRSNQMTVIHEQGSPSNMYADVNKVSLYGNSIQVGPMRESLSCLVP